MSKESAETMYRFGKKCWYAILIFGFAIWVLNRIGYTFYVNSYLYFHAMICIIVGLAFAMAVGNQIYKKKPLRWIIFTGIAGIITVLCFQVRYGQERAAHSYIAEVSSPDGQHVIVLYEYRGMFLNYGTVYETVSPLFMKKMGNYSCENVSPARENAYQIAWEDDGFIFRYQFQRMSERYSVENALALKYE
ncbi:MAG: hypothetical protein PHV18_14475 [Lachnospiraceae bacterium]|nr:hypothetical protein [Lachnospiraceae bacterium]